METTIVVNDKQFKKFVTGMKKKAQDLRRPLVLIARRMLAYYGMTFRDKEEPKGTSWPDYRSTWLYRGRGKSRKRVKPRREMLLIDTGRLRQSLKVGASGNIFDSGQFSITFGTDVPYAAAHHYGVPQRNLPRRRFLDWVPGKYDRELIRVIELYLFGKGLVV